MSLRARVSRLESRAPRREPLRSLSAWVSRIGVDRSDMGFRDSTVPIEVIGGRGGHYLVMVRVPEEADYYDCHTFMTREQLDLCLFAGNLILLLWPPRGIEHARFGGPPSTALFCYPNIEQARMARQAELRDNMR